MASSNTPNFDQVRAPRRFQLARAEDLRRFAPVPRIAANGAQWLAVAGWKEIPWLWHGFSTRRGGLSRAYCGDGEPGELNLGFTAADVRETVSANRRLLVEAVTGSAETPLVTVSQIHSNLVLRMGAEDRLREQPCKGDGILTDEPGILLGVQTADCIPVLLADRKRRAVAAIHAGWRGTVERIVEDGVERMRREFGCLPEDLIAAIGPGIGACCYAVGEEVLSGFTAQFAYAEELFSEVEGPALHLDLVEANRRQLLAAGLGPESISVVGGCTSCQPEMFFSHRASKGHAGRMMAVIGVRGAAE